MNSEFTFFWAGPFSQWARSPFKLEGKTFVTAEQYMMYKKAMLFGDTEIADRIMRTSDPKIQKSLGRKVKNFDAVKWNAVARQVVYDGNMAKFTQNQSKQAELLGTFGTTLVEASHVDFIWGIGLTADKADVTPPHLWPGTNWLGLTLTKVRDDIINRCI